MNKPVSPRRRRFRLAAALASTLALTGAVAALAFGVTPAAAADFVRQPDTQIAVFMVPLTLLVLAVLFEVVRFALVRDTLPGGLPAARPRREALSPLRKT